MTEITLKLYPLPEAVSAAICTFPSIDAAVRTTIQIIQMGVPIARCELLDANAVRAVNKHSNLSLMEAPLLLMEFHGSEAGVKEQAETVQDVAREFGGQDFQWASTPEERTKLWTARHKAYFAALQTRPGCRCQSSDTCVPISHLAESINESVAESEAAGIPYWIVGHVGDGNFHLSHLIDPNDPREQAVVEELNVKMVRRAHPPGGHLHRRAWHRPAQDGLPGGRGRRRGGGDDEDHQARAGSEEHHEPGQGAAVGPLLQGLVHPRGAAARAVVVATRHTAAQARRSLPIGWPPCRASAA
jgi:FAD/FMN-containing dehydrogenase